MFPIWLFIVFVLGAAIISIIKVKSVDKQNPINEVKPEEPVEDVFHNMGIQSETPKIIVQRKKPVLKKKDPIKKPVKTNSHKVKAPIKKRKKK